MKVLLTAYIIFVSYNKLIGQRKFVQGLTVARVILMSNDPVKLDNLDIRRCSNQSVLSKLYVVVTGIHPTIKHMSNQF